MHPSTPLFSMTTVAASLAAAAVAAVALATPSVAGEWAQRANARSGWVCNAYGRGGNHRSAWHTVSGERSGNEAAAKASAMSECRSRYSGCQPTGCWQG